MNIPKGNGGWKDAKSKDSKEKNCGYGRVAKDRWLLETGSIRWRGLRTNPREENRRNKHSS